MTVLFHLHPDAVVGGRPIVTCLFASEGYDLRGPLRAGESDEAIAERIRRVWSRRRDRYSEERLHHAGIRKRRKVEMSYIGG